MVGSDGGFFAFGDAGFHGSLPGIGIHTEHVVGMVANPAGTGYLLVGWDWRGRPARSPVDLGARASTGDRNCR
jgi:hypothetical protein